MLGKKNLPRCQYSFRCQNYSACVCALLSVMMRAEACRVDKVLSSATARIAAEALSALQRARLFEVVAEELALAFALGVIKTLWWWVSAGGKHVSATELIRELLHHTAGETYKDGAGRGRKKKIHTKEGKDELMSGPPCRLQDEKWREAKGMREWRSEEKEWKIIWSQELFSTAAVIKHRHALL